MKMSYSRLSTVIVAILIAGLILGPATIAQTTLGPQTATNSADFTITLSPSSISLPPGATGSSLVTLTGVNEFHGTVDLSTAVAPAGAAGLSVSLSASSVQLKASGNFTATVLLGVSTTSSTPPATYSVNVTGTTNKLSHSAQLSAVVTAPPDFALSLSPSSMSVPIGTSRTSLVTVLSQNGFTGNVALAVSNIPLGVGVGFIPPEVLVPSGGNGTATLFVNVGLNAVLGSYPVYVTGTSGSLSRVTTLILTISSETGPDFSISVAPTSLSITRGSTGFVNITFASIAGFNGTVSVFGDILPRVLGGPGFGISPAIVNLSVGGFATSVMTIFTDSNTTLGFYNFTVTGTNGSLFHAVFGSLTVTGGDVPPLASFTFTPLNVTVGQIVTFDASSSFDPDGFIVIYTWDFGDGVIASSTSPLLNHVYIAPGSYNVTLAVMDNGGMFGTASKVIQVSPGGVNIPPIASFIFTPNNATVGQLVVFDGSSSFDPDGFILAWLWSFGDGTIIVNNQSLATHSYLAQGTYVVTLTVLDNGNMTGTTSQLISIRPATVDIPPVASFIFFPTTPQVGVPVSFDASGSFDPDGFITSYNWDFGDGFFVVGGAFVSHTYFAAGNYTVTLTVVDNAGLSATSRAAVLVTPRLTHDVAVVGLFVNTPVAVQGQPVGVQVQLANFGLQTENVSLALYFGSIQVALSTRISVSPGPYGTFIFLSVGTGAIAPGNYTVSATVFLSTDQNPANNSFTDGQVTILPPPVITVTPSSGRLGTKLLVQGSGFPQPQYGYPSQIFVTFDDMFMGFAISNNGTFSFTFDVPHAEPGLHLVKAMDTFSLARATADFLVIAEPTGNLQVNIHTGDVYFPGDTADITILATLNGIPTGPAGIQLQVTLLLPNGTLVTLTPTSIAPGLYKAQYAISSAAPLGTYSVVVNAQMGGSLNASTLGGFVVKPSWVTAQTPTIATTAAITGLVGLVALAWRKGYFKKDELQMQ